jgi:predicted nucleotidyltransferase
VTWKPTPYSSVNIITEKLLSEIQQILGDKLVGLYLYGSATAGDFDSAISDIDLLVAINSVLTKTEFEQIRRMHNDLATKFPEWKDRIETVYVTLKGLHHFRDQKSEVAGISPGEPFHLKKIGKEWLVNWFTIRISGKVLYGPGIDSIIPNISRAEYIAFEKEQILRWRDWILDYNEKSTRGSVAYVIFTMCRAMYNFTHEDRASKIQSAKWVSQTFPQWSELVSKAGEWRRVQWYPKQVSVGTDLSKVIEFVNFAVDQIADPPKNPR